MIYFEDARLEFLGVPMAYFPYFSAPDPTVKRKTGVLMPTYSTSNVYGLAVTVPYFWALAPNYDVTFTPMITTRQGPLLQGEWRHRLLNGAYAVRVSGVFQLDKDVFGVDTPGYRDWRGSLESSGQFNLSEKWVWGWDGTLLSDKTYLQDYGLYKVRQSADLLKSTPDYALSQLYIAGRGDRSYFDARALYFFGFSPSDDQKQIPIVHPVVDHQYVLKNPIFGGELGFYTNLTSLSRDTANFDPISQAAVTGNLCAPTTADPAVKNSNNCLLRGVPGNYTRLSSEATWRRTVIDPLGSDVHALRHHARRRCQHEHRTRSRACPTMSMSARPMSAASCRRPASNTAIRSSACNPGARRRSSRSLSSSFVPTRPASASFPNEDAQSLIYDDSNLFKVNKFSGWDRVEGGGRANVGVQYTAQFNRGGNVNVLFGQSYQLFGQNSFALGGTTNTGLDSGLDTARSDYVARASYQPNSTFMFTSRFRFDETDFTLQRTELETTANFGRWTTQLMYGSYAAQPALGFLERREGILGNARLKVNPNWVLLAAARYDLRAHQVSQTQIGVGYIDDCLILALNYITDYAYSGSVSVNHTYMMQVSLRTLGGNTPGQGAIVSSGRRDSPARDDRRRAGGNCRLASTRKRTRRGCGRSEHVRPSHDMPQAVGGCDIGRRRADAGDHRPSPARRRHRQWRADHGTRHRAAQQAHSIVDAKAAGAAGRHR